MLSFMPRESYAYPLGKHLAASKRRHTMTWTIVIHFFSHIMRKLEVGVYKHLLSSSKTQGPTSLWCSWPSLHGYIIDTTGLGNIFMFSAEEEGSRKGKCYATRYILWEFQKLFQKALNSFLPLSHGYLWMYRDGKEVLGFSALKMWGPKKKRVKNHISITSKN